MVSVLLASANLITFLFSVGEKEAKDKNSECDNHLCAVSGL